MKYWVKKHYEFRFEDKDMLEKKKTFVLAICDYGLIGRRLNSGIDNSSIISEEFYMGELVEEERVEELLKDDNILSINAIGKNSVGLLKRLGIVKKEEVKKINGVEHAIVFFI